MSDYITLKELSSYNNIRNIISSTPKNPFTSNINIPKNNNNSKNNSDIMTETDKKKFKDILSSSNQKNSISSIEKENDKIDNIINNISLFFNELQLKKYFELIKNNKITDLKHLKNINFIGLNGDKEDFKKDITNSIISKIIDNTLKNEDIIEPSCLYIKKTNPNYINILKLSLSSISGWDKINLNNHGIGNIEEIYNIILITLNKKKDNIDIFQNIFKNIFKIYDIDTSSVSKFEYKEKDFNYGYDIKSLQVLYINIIKNKSIQNCNYYKDYKDNIENIIEKINNSDLENVKKKSISELIKEIKENKKVSSNNSNYLYQIDSSKLSKSSISSKSSINFILPKNDTTDILKTFNILLNSINKINTFINYKKSTELKKFILLLYSVFSVITDKLEEYKEVFINKQNELNKKSNNSISNSEIKLKKNINIIINSIDNIIKNYNNIIINYIKFIFGITDDSLKLNHNHKLDITSKIEFGEYYNYLCYDNNSSNTKFYQQKFNDKDKEKEIIKNILNSLPITLDNDNSKVIIDKENSIFKFLERAQKIDKNKEYALGGSMQHIHYSLCSIKTLSNHYKDIIRSKNILKSKIEILVNNLSSKLTKQQVSDDFNYLEANLSLWSDDTNKSVKKININNIVKRFNIRLETLKKAITKYLEIKRDTLNNSYMEQSYKIEIIKKYNIQVSINILKLSSYKILFKHIYSHYYNKNNNVYTEKQYYVIMNHFIKKYAKYNRLIDKTIEKASISMSFDLSNQSNNYNYNKNDNNIDIYSDTNIWKTLHNQLNDKHVYIPFVKKIKLLTKSVTLSNLKNTLSRNKLKLFNISDYYLNGCTDIKNYITDFDIKYFHGYILVASKEKDKCDKNKQGLCLKSIDILINKTPESKNKFIYNLLHKSFNSIYSFNSDNSYIKEMRNIINKDELICNDFLISREKINNLLK